LTIQKFADAIVEKYGTVDEKAMLFPTARVCQQFLDFFLRNAPQADQSVQTIKLARSSQRSSASDHSLTDSAIYACLFPSKLFSIAKQYWQHAGAGVSSRRAEYFYTLFENGLLVKTSSPHSETESPCKGPRRYQRKVANGTVLRDGEAPEGYIEERFGRNLDISLASSAKLAVRRRIAGKLTADVDLKQALQLSPNEETTKRRRGISEDDVYLYPTGMNAIHSTHQCLLHARGQIQSVCYG
jgi:cystathionine gamma-synthase